MEELIHIDNLCSRCGFFTSDTSVNGGYGCNHKDCDDGEYIYNGDNLYVCDNKVFRECELDFLNLGNSAIDWEKRRYELAKDYSTEFVKLQHKKGITECGILYPDVVSWSVELADALIKKLKGE